MARRSCRPARLDFRNRKSSRATCQCTALIAVITAVSPVCVACSDSPRRSRNIFTVGTICVKIMVKMLAVNEVINGHYA